MQLLHRENYERTMSKYLTVVSWRRYLVDNIFWQNTNSFACSLDHHCTGQSGYNMFSILNRIYKLT